MQEPEENPKLTPTIQKLKQDICDDPALSKLYTVITDGWPPLKTVSTNMSSTMLDIIEMSSQYRMASFTKDAVF